MTPYRVLGVPIAPLTYGQVLEWIGERRSHPARGAASLVFANVHVVTEAALDPAFRSVLETADLILPDGMPLVWAGRMLGSPLRQRCYGPETMALVLARSELTGWTHFFYGSTPQVLEALTRTVAHRWPEAKVVGAMTAPFGPFDDRQEHANIDIINRTGADCVWVGLGCPRQELWMQRYRGSLHCTAVLGVGAAFDFLAGTKPQAPRWMQRSGLEWLFRLISEPRRLARRYLVRNPYFIMQFALQLLGLRWRHLP